MNVRKLLRSKLTRKADVPKPLPALVGDGAGTVEVPGRDKYVYVRIGNSLAQAYCDYVPRHGAKVLVGYDTINPRLFRVLSEGGASNSAGEVTAERFRWAAPGGGQDPLMVELRQFLPARVGPAGGLKVSVYPGLAWCVNAWKVIGGETIDLSSYVPTASGKSRMVLLSVGGNGNVTVTAGSEVDTGNLSLSNLPAPPAGAVYALAGVRLYDGQTEIREGRTNTDIADLRFPVAQVSAGDMTKAVYDTDNDGVVDAAESVPWSSVTDKPSTFPPDAHTHLMTDITGGMAKIRVQRSSNQSIPSATWTELSFDTIIYESRPGSESQWSSGSPTRLICRLAGVYLVIAHVRFATNSVGTRGINLLKNGDAMVANVVHTSSTWQIHLQVSEIMLLNVGDYVFTRVYQDSGGALDVISTSNNLYLEWIRLGP